MLEEIKNQFYSNTLNQLQLISQKLSQKTIPAEEIDILVNNIFSISHLICGTGPMLGFDRTAKLSGKLEKTFSDIRSGGKCLTKAILQQTQRAIGAMIQTLNEEQSQK